MAKKKKTEPTPPNRIAKRREELGLTQDQLAEMVGVSQSNIVRYESGAVDPPASKLVKLSTALKCEINDLFGPKPPKFITKMQAMSKDLKSETQDQVIAIAETLKDREKAS